MIGGISLLDGDAANCLRGLGDFHRVTVGIECNQVITPVFQPFGDLLLVKVIPVDRQQRAEWGCFLQLDRGDVISVPGLSSVPMLKIERASMLSASIKQRAFSSSLA
jgi:exosome complex RNA-binding protein Rrp4